MNKILETYDPRSYKMLVEWFKYSYFPEYTINYILMNGKVMPAMTDVVINYYYK